tara:strand:- start:291 stop:767 length:477 start_codon:yes stop_codon:yes gene_type:complete
MNTSHSIESNSLSSETIVVKTATCKSLSGMSELTYHIACDSDNEVYFRVAENSGKGFFSCEWIALSAIEAVIKDKPAMTGITAFMFNELFTGKSVNTPAFLLAVLKAENLVQPLPNRRRSHEVVPNNTFLDDIYRLVDTIEESNPSIPKPTSPVKSAR